MVTIAGVNQDVAAWRADEKRMETQLEFTADLVDAAGVQPIDFCIKVPSLDIRQKPVSSKAHAGDFNDLLNAGLAYVDGLHATIPLLRYSRLSLAVAMTCPQRCFSLVIKRVSCALSAWKGVMDWAFSESSNLVSDRAVLIE